MGSTLTFMLTETELHSHLPTCCTVWVPAARFGFLSCHHTLKVADLVQARGQVQLTSASNGWRIDIPTPQPSCTPNQFAVRFGFLTSVNNTGPAMQQTITIGVCSVGRPLPTHPFGVVAVRFGLLSQHHRFKAGAQTRPADR